MIRYGIVIPYTTNIGPGFYIGHFGGIVINSNVVIGSNVNISHGITIGQGGDDGNKGCPTLGANAFVNKNVDAGVTVAGIPAKQISSKGSSNYVHNLI